MRTGNRAKTFLLLFVFSAVLMGTGFLAAGKAGLLVAAGMSLLPGMGAWRFGDRFLLRHFDARPLSFVEAPGLHRAAQRLARLAGMPVPRLYVIPEAAPNAFATGRAPSAASIALTEGLLQRLTATETEAVIAQQLALVDRRYTLLATVTATFTGSLACVTNFLLWGTLAAPVAAAAQPVSPFAGLSGLVFRPLAGLLVRLCRPAEQQQDADARSVEWTGAPLVLASALGKIAGRAPWTPMDSGGPEMAHVFLVNPFPSELSFRMHPDTQDRIRRLEAMRERKQHAA